MPVAGTIQGGKVSGSFFGGETYRGIDGLKLWLQRDMGLTDLSGRVILHADQIGLNDFTGLSGTAKPQLVAVSGHNYPAFGEGTSPSAVQNGLIAPGASKNYWTFLYNGNPFLFFWLLNPRTVKTDQNPSIISTVLSAASSGYTLSIRYDLRRVTANIFNGSGTALLAQSTSSNTINRSGWQLVCHQFNGYNVSGNDSEIYINNVLSNGADCDTTHGGPASSPGVGSYALKVVGQNDEGMLSGAILAYDCNGLSKSQIDTKRAAIIKLINSNFSDIITVTP